MTLPAILRNLSPALTNQITSEKIVKQIIRRNSNLVNLSSSSHSPSSHRTFPPHSRASPPHTASPSPAPPGCRRGRRSRRRERGKLPRGWHMLMEENVTLTLPNMTCLKAGNIYPGKICPFYICFGLERFRLKHISFQFPLKG